AMAGDGAKSRSTWRASAERAFAARDYKMAIERYEKAGDAAGAAGAMIQLGKAAQERKDFVLALEWFAKAGSAKNQLAAHAAWAEAAAAAGKRAEAAEHFRLAGDVAAARASERALGKELLEQGDYARAYALLSPDGPESAAAALIAVGRAKGTEARVETALVAAGLPEKTVRESIAQAAYEAGDFLVALSYVDKLGDAARSAALLEGAATQAVSAGRLDELYRIRLRTAKDAKEAQESVVKAGIEAGKITETRAFLEKTGMKSADAATRIADIAFAQGGWDLAADLYAVAGKKSKSAESFSKASEEAARRGDWESAASYLVKTGMKRSDADRKLASDAIERGDYPKAIELGLRGGLTELEAASRVADDLFKKQGYPEGYKFLRSHGASEKEAAQRAAEAADKAGASAAASEYYRLAGNPDKAYPYEQRVALAEFAAGRYDEGFAILERGSMDGKKAAEAAGDAAAKNQAAARAVEFYLRADLPAKAAPFFEKASMEKALEGDLDLAEDYARRSGKKVNIDFVEVLKACRSEMIAYIDAKEGIEPQDFVDYLKTLEKRYGSRIVWETLKNSALYYLKLGADLLTGTDISKIGSAEIAKIDKYSSFSKILSTLYGEMGK
ncbi:MAG: hypothetical protein Q8M76_07555, partial [Spirochaetaceae bacterium]|nr:hypothetical protein [Spirochaetaceae bacterium]